jgi:D-amino-acid dehydrogenase
MARAVVIGGGVIGLSCGYSLRKRGLDVTILDAAAPGAGASEGNAGWVTPSLSGPVPSPGVVGDSLKWLLKSDSPLYVKPTLDPRRIRWLLRLLRNCNEPAYRAGLLATARLGERTFELFEAMEEDDVDFEHHRAGMLFAFLDPDHRTHVLDDLEMMRPFGYSPVELGADDIRDVQPGLSSDIKAAILLAEERQVRPETLITGLAKWLLREGADLRVASPVTGVVRAGGRVTGLEVPDGILDGDEFVIAAGAHSGRVARLFGARVPMEAGKGYSLHFEPPPVDISHALYLYEARVGATPFDGALRLAGTMEFSGINSRLAPKRIGALYDAASRYLDGWPEGTEGRAWTGMRPMTPDGLPVIGRLGQNVTIASGHAMLGVTLAPVTGELVAELIATGTEPQVLEPFTPTRFS